MLFDSRRMDIASVRILRMAFGTALSLWFSQAVGWQMSFVAPIFTMLVLSLPFPAPGLKSGIKFVLALLISVYAGLALLPLLLNQRWVGILLLTLAVFYSFYYTARGGNAVVGTFATVGIGLATAVGTVSIDGALAVVGGLGITAVCGILFVWIAHAILPDSMAAPVSEPATATPPTPPKPDLAAARRSAFRSLAIVMPVLLWFLLSSASASYLAVMIKVASMGQQAEADQTKQVGKSLLVSTIIGGIGAIIGWQVLSMWPSLLMYTLLLALAGLVMGRKIFAGRGMHPAAGTWSYGYLTMVIILAPAVLDGTSGSAADAAFWSRLSMFFYATIYGIVAVSVFDAFWPRKESEIK
jgi:hypothetical protein